MNKNFYKPRIIDKQVKEYLNTFGAICIEGPKWCGKTWTSSYHCNSEFYLADPAGNFQNRKLAEISPDTILDGATPRLIDEWQEYPPLWDAVRHKVDQTNQKGQFILTGSATPNHKGILHSGAGRIGKLRMRPMSLYESGDSSGHISLESLCQGKLTPVITGEVNLKDIITFIIRGGWPGSLNLPVKQAALLPQQYLQAVLDDDIYRIDDVKRNTQKMRLLLMSLARNESTTATNTLLKSDIKEKDGQDIDANTVTAYLDIFKRLFLTDNQPPFAPNVRSSVRVKQAEKRHLADPSLACALLKLTPAALLNDLETLARGIEIEKGKIAYADAMIVEYEGKNTILQITLYQGLNRQIRKMLDFIGHPVRSLKRISHGTINIQGLKKGQFKYIKPKEIRDLLKQLEKAEKMAEKEKKDNK